MQKQITSLVLFTGTISSVATIWKAAAETDKVYVVRMVANDPQTKLKAGEVKRNTSVLPNVKWVDKDNNPLVIEYMDYQVNTSNDNYKSLLVKAALMATDLGATKLYLPFSKSELVDCTSESMYSLLDALTRNVNKKLGNYATDVSSLKIMDDTMFSIEAYYINKSLASAIKHCSKSVPSWKSLSATTEDTNSAIRVKAFAEAELPDPSMIRFWHDTGTAVPATVNYDSFRKFISTQALDGKYHTIGQIIELCLAFSLKNAPTLHGAA